MVEIPNPLVDGAEEEQTEQIEEKLEEVPEKEVKESPLPKSDRGRCTRFEVCGNIVYGSTCPECWEDIRKQLDTGRCDECGNNRFKFVPDGEEVGLKCNQCGEVDWQTVEYTGEQEEEDPRNNV